MQWTMQTDQWRRIQEQRWDEVRAARQAARQLRRLRHASNGTADRHERLTILGRLFAHRAEPVQQEHASLEPLTGSQDVSFAVRDNVIEIERVRVGAAVSDEDVCLACCEEAG